MEELIKHSNTWSENASLFQCKTKATCLIEISSYFVFFTNNTIDRPNTKN